MKKFCLLFVVLVTLGLGVTACKKEKLAHYSTTTPTNGPVELKLKWTKGERVLQSMVMTQEMVLTIPNVPTPMNQQTAMGQDFGFTVLSETPDGGHEVELDFVSAKMRSAMGDRVLFDYDSADKTKATSPDGKPNPIGDLFSKIIGSKVKFSLDSSNQVERIEGADELIAKLSTGMQADQLASLKGLYSPGYLKQMMSQYQFLPTHPVQMGDTWPVHMEIPMETMGTLVTDYTFTFQDWELHGKRQCARLDFDGKITAKPDANADSSKMNINISDGTCSGTSWFDPELGITIDTVIHQDMKMNITVPVKTAPGGKQSISSQMNQVINITLLSVQ